MGNTEVRTGITSVSWQTTAGLCSSACCRSVYTDVTPGNTALQLSKMHDNTVSIACHVPTSGAPAATGCSNVAALSRAEQPVADQQHTELSGHRKLDSCHVCSEQQVTHTHTHTPGSAVAGVGEAGQVGLQGHPTPFGEGPQVGLGGSM